MRPFARGRAPRSDSRPHSPTLPHGRSPAWGIGSASLPIYARRVCPRGNCGCKIVEFRTAAMGHQHAFLRPRPSARYQFSQGTLAGPRGRLAAPISDSCGRGLVLIDDPHRPGPTKLSTSQYDRLDGANVQAHCEARAKSLVDEGSLWSPYQASSGITLSARQSG